MKSHLVKCLAFFGFQVIVLAGFLRFDTGAQPPSTAVALPGNSAEDLLEGFLRETLYSRWQRDRDVVAALASSPSNDPKVSTIAQEYLSGPDNYLAALIDKDALLKNAPGPRMVFLGGSGLAFGLDSQVIKDRYGYTPINYGLHIRIGPEFMLRHVADHLRSGDVVVLCVEYDGMLAGFDTTAERRAEVCAISPDFERYFQARSNESTLGTASADPVGLHGNAEVNDHAPVNGVTDPKYYADLKYYADKKALADFAAAVRRSTTEIARRWNPPEETDPRSEFDAVFDAFRDQLVTTVGANPHIRNQLYRRSFFNSYGDFTGHLVHADRQRLIDKNNWPAMIHTALPPTAAELVVANVERLNAFAAECRAKDVKILFSYTPLMDTPQTPKFASEYSAVVEKHLTIPVLFPITESIRDIDEFYDSINHLNWAGIQRRMTTLATALDRHFAPHTTVDVRAQVADRDHVVRGRYKITHAGELLEIH